MKDIKITLITLLILCFAANAYGQEKREISGKILSELNAPIEGAIISAWGAEDVVTGKDGTFRIELTQETKQLSIWAAGYNPVTQLLNGRKAITVVLIPEDHFKHSEQIVLPFRVEETKATHTLAENIAKKDFLLGSSKIDQALSGQVAGLKVTRSSGMPGEGSYMNLRGIRSFVGENAPLIVINNVPYLPDSRESQLINGFTRNIFQAYNIMDIQNITVLKGAEASMYGSMGSNGVILIETDGASSDDLETKVSFYGQYGMNWNNKRMPLLKGLDYKSYLSDVGMTYYDNMENFFTDFPFLGDPDNKYNYLYNNQTDWQDLIYKKSFVTDNLFRVEGGDAIAKYDLSLGYVKEDGILESTESQRYHTQLNANVLVSKKVELYTTVGLAYLTGNYQEQGMISQTNPILATYAQSPLLSPYIKNNQGGTMPAYSTYYYGICENPDFAVSNPLAIVNTLNARNRQYDINIKVGINYKLLPELTLTGVASLFYNYNSENLFVPGLSDVTIVPFFDQYGEAKNTVKKGVGERLNWFYNLNARYNKTFDGIHALNAVAGIQVVTTKNEYDAGVGRNTANDFYQTLGNVDKIGRYFYGYLDKWNWMNYYGHVDYTYNDMISASANLAVDASSATGTYGTLFYMYPSVGLTWLGKGWLPLSNSTLVNQLNVRAEYGLTGNSRFSSNYGKYYYRSSPYQDISGIVRANVPNTKLKPEKTAQLNLGLEASLFYNRLDLSLNYYNQQTSDAIFSYPLSSGYGTGNYYGNFGKLENQGFEVAMQLSVIRLRDFEWIVGGNIARNKNKIKSLSGADQLVVKYDNSEQLVNRVGESPYQFYGYQSLGVFSTQAEANAAGLVSNTGRNFQAGDVHYVDQNGDGRIDDKDRVALGSAAPKYFGGFYTHIKYKSFALSAEFSYSKGNKAYNAVRRSLESMSTFENQSVTVANRWNLEGQETSVPRAQWSDPLGNNDFSSRWIEDASYLRMKSVTLSYSFDKKLLNFVRSGTFYITGENLLTATKYLGLDPEFSYSYGDAVQGFDYAKLMQPKSIKLGVNLKF